MTGLFTIRAPLTLAAVTSLPANTVREVGHALTTSAPQVIWMSAVSWDDIAGTDRQLATAMTRHAHVLWVDPPVSLLTTVRRRGGIKRSVRPRLYALDSQMSRLTPTALPGMTRPGVRVTTGPLVRAQVRSALRRMGIQPFAVVVTHLHDVLRGWGDGTVKVLYGTDDYVAGAELMRLSARWLLKKERVALARADVVAAVSPQLADRWSSLGASPLIIPNGCHVVPPDQVPPTPIAAGLPRPVVGLVGQLSERIDIAVLEAITDAGFSLLMVGPHDPRWVPRRFASLITRPEVHYAGRVPVTAVPAYLAAIDVGITPYSNSPFNDASFPLKTLEYLGAGRPVVSSALPAARWLRDDLARSAQAAAASRILALAASPSEFVAAIRTIVGDPAGPSGCRAERSGDQLDLADQCRAFAAEHSWSRRAATFAAAISLPAASAEAGSAQAR